jgi:hypothetical protein
VVRGGGVPVCWLVSGLCVHAHTYKRANWMGWTQHSLCVCIVCLPISQSVRPSLSLSVCRSTHVDDAGEDEPEVGLGQHAALEALVVARRVEKRAEDQAHPQRQPHQHQQPVLCVWGGGRGEGDRIGSDRGVIPPR